MPYRAVTVNRLAAANLFSASVIGFVLLSVASATADEKPVDFSREVLPVLSDKCFVCHGPDSAEKSDLRLDSTQGATADLGGYRAIVPHKPNESELVARIHDHDDPMPPADGDKQLTDTERELLTRWIRQGGEYARHWAYITPKHGDRQPQGLPSTTRSKRVFQPASISHPKRTELHSRGARRWF